MKRMSCFSVMASLALAVVMLAGCALYPGVSGRQSWQEEVRLHDGRSVIVERSQTTDMFGRREIGQKPPLSKEDLWFRTPEGREVTWQSDFGPGYEDNLSPLVLDIVEGTPYLITNPTRCHAYNKWGRPNPPYIYFKHDGKQWQRIPLTELPAVMTQANLIIGGMFSSEQDIPDVYRRGPYIPAAGVDYANRQMGRGTQHLRVIVREPMNGKGCQELVPDGKGGWLSPDWFYEQPNLAACVATCKRKKIEGEYCLCGRYFSKEHEE